MKKLYFLTIAMVGFSVVSNAQISKGSTFLGGSVNFSSSSNKDEDSSPSENKNNEWGIRPQLGKAIGTNKILGAFLSYSSSKRQSYPDYYPGPFPTTPPKYNDNSTTYGGGIFYRQYYPFSNRFYVFGEGSLGTFFGKVEGKRNDVLTREQKTTDINLALTPGISFAATKKLHLEASLGNLLSLNYASSKTKEFSSSGQVINPKTGQSFSASANASGFNNISVGLRWILPSKK